MCCSRALYTANQIYFGPKNSGGGDLCHFHEVTGGTTRPLCRHGAPGLGGCCESGCSPAPRCPQAELTYFPRQAPAHLCCPFPDEGGEAGRGPTTQPSPRLGCTMLAVASEAGFSPPQVRVELTLKHRLKEALWWVRVC